MFPTITSTRLPSSACPVCGTLLDAATGKTGTRPKPGDLTLCIKCGEILIFEDDMFLKVAPAQVLESLSREKYEYVRRIQRNIRSRLN